MIGEDLREPDGFLERRRSGMVAEGGGRAVVEKEAFYGRSQSNNLVLVRKSCLMKCHEK